ncbi:MAG TPA: EAL domain-containing protein, partial [Dehalococcoidia bacterium]|nr:EAL domain-containing protein [Dehalococcoidia bacterium]
AVGRVRDDRRRAVDLSVQPLLDEAGRITYLVASAMDISERKRAEDALRASEEKHRDLVENLNEIIYVQDRTGVVTYVSPAVRQIGGYTPDEVIGKRFVEFIHPEDLPMVVESFRRTISGAPEPLEYRAVTKEGEVRWVRSYSRLIYDGDEIGGLQGILVDISESRRAEEALRESEERLRTVVASTPVVLFALDREGLFTMSEGKGLSALGLEPGQVVGQSVFEVYKDVPAVMENVRRALAGEAFASIVEVGDLVFETWYSPLLGSGEVNGVIGVAVDITERKQAEEAMRHLAYHDALTGLPNRALLKDRLTVALAQAKRSGQPLAVMFLDLDRFKVVNDTVGHSEGDRLLKAVAERLRGLVREGDTVARVGGDEFTLLLPGIAGSEDAQDVAERVLASFRQPRVVAGHEFQVTTSVGVTIAPTDGKDAEALLRNADTAMYRAKERGRNNYQMYSPAMNVNVLKRLGLENDLRHALDRDQFVVYYQPQVDVRAREMVGLEALVRWLHPQRGLVGPAEFIPVAEETGLIVALGQWVLRTACAQTRAWGQNGLPSLSITVNLSARQFQERDMAESVSRVLQETDLDPRWLQLEITEGTAMQDVEFSIATLEALRAMGIRISIDDFGTGYSSLGYLKQLPADAVKIDRSFVSDLTTDPSDAAIATAIIAMAHSLKLRVIAEGVETREQLEFLKQRRCYEMQGYLFGRPMAPDVLEKRLARGNGMLRAAANGQRSR